MTIKRKTQSADQRTLDAMANEYSVRARQARLKQGLPPVVASPNALNRLAHLMADPVETARPSHDQGAA